MVDVPFHLFIFSWVSTGYIYISLSIMQLCFSLSSLNPCISYSIANPFPNHYHHHNYPKYPHQPNYLRKHLLPPRTRSKQSRTHANGLLEAVPPTPVDGLTLEEDADGAQVALVAQEIGLLGALGPELDGVG